MMTRLLGRDLRLFAVAALLFSVSGCTTFFDDLPENTGKRDSNADNVFESSINYGKYCPGEAGENGYQCFRYGPIENFENEVQFFHPCYNVKTADTNPATGSVAVETRRKNADGSIFRREVVLDLQCRKITDGKSRTGLIERVKKITVLCKNCADEKCDDYKISQCSNEDLSLGDADVKLTNILKSRRKDHGRFRNQAVAMATTGFRLNKQYCSEFSRELGRRQRYRAEAIARLGVGNIVISSFLALAGAAPAAVGLSAVSFQAGQSYIQEFDSIYSFGGETGRIFEVAAKAMDEIEASTLPGINRYERAVDALQRHSQVCSNAGIAKLLDYSVKRVVDGNVLRGNVLPTAALRTLPTEVQQMLGGVLSGQLPVGEIKDSFDKLPDTAKKIVQQQIGVVSDGQFGNETKKALDALHRSSPVTPLADLFL